MIQFSTQKNIIEIKNADGKSIFFDTSAVSVKLQDFDVTHPGEYEKSGNLLEVKEYQGSLFYKFLVDSKHLAIVTSESFEMQEEILSFFGDIDVLIIIGSKAAVKVFENIEAKVVIPYGEAKDIFFTTVAKHPEAVSVFKVGSELDGDSTEFVNLA
jgi:hypothetical protein